MIEEGQRKGLIATQSNNGGGIQAGLSIGKTRESILDLGLTSKQSSTFQQIASIPEDDFEEFIQGKKEAVNKATAELTMAGAANS